MSKCSDLKSGLFCDSIGNSTHSKTDVSRVEALFMLELFLTGEKSF